MPSCCHGCKFASSDFTLSGGVTQYAPDLLLEPKHIQAYFNVNIEDASMKAEVINHIEVNAPAKSLALNGVNFADVSVEDLDSSDNKFSWSYDGQKIFLNWENNLQKGCTKRVKVCYTINNPVTGLIFVNTGHGNDSDKNMRLFYALTDNETERARYWLACVDYPTIRTTLEYFITASKDLVIVANGLLQSESENGDGTKVAHWKLDHPCPSYLACFGVGDFVTVNDSDVHGIPVSYLAPKGVKESDLKLTFNKTPSMLSWLEKRTGNPFPFKKYYQIICPKAGGAMENISLVTWDGMFILDSHFEKEWGLLVDMINIHEAAHSYFGDAVVIRHFEHAWLKESWATYIETEWLKDFMGEDERRYEMYQMKKGYFEETEDYIRPIVTRTYDSSWNLFDRHLYPGGAMRLHMLRMQLGDDVFWGAIADYLRKYSQQTVETDDFRKVLEHHSKLNLTKFFDQWLYGATGFPQLKLDYDYDSGTKTVKITLEQVQYKSDPKRHVFAFDVDVELTLSSADSNSAKTSEIKTISFDGRSDRAFVTFACQASEPHMLRMDPFNKVLFRINESNLKENILGNTLVESSDIENRITAAAALIKIGSKPAIQRVANAVRNEPFHGVRVQIAQLLAEHKTQYTVELLCEILQNETHHRALEDIAACCKFRDEGIKNALLTFLAQKDLPYRAHARALEAYAMQSIPKDKEAARFELIVQHLEADQRQPSAFVRSGALRGLGHTHTKQAFEYLKQRVLYGQEIEFCRPAAIDGLAECGSGLKKRIQNEVIEILRMLLRDTDELVRKAAINGLVKLKAAAVASDVEASKPMFSNQSQIWVERRLRQLKKTDQDAASLKLQKEVDGLNEKIRKLERQVEDLTETTKTKQ